MPNMTALATAAIFAVSSFALTAPSALATPVNDRSVLSTGVATYPDTGGKQMIGSRVFENGGSQNRRVEIRIERP